MTTSSGWQAPDPEPGPAPGVAFAGAGARLVAYIIDIVVTFVVIIVLVIVAGLSVVAFPPLAIVPILAIVVIPLVYFPYFWVHSGQTPGMSAMGIKVVRDSDGGPVSVGQAILRLLG